jgi:hypothetical protein
MGKPQSAYCPHFAFHNFCRTYKTPRVTPAMESGLTDHVWELGKSLGGAAREKKPPSPRSRHSQKYFQIRPTSRMYCEISALGVYSLLSLEFYPIPAVDFDGIK